MKNCAPSPTVLVREHVFWNQRPTNEVGFVSDVSDLCRELFGIETLQLAFSALSGGIVRALGDLQCLPRRCRTHIMRMQDTSYRCGPIMHGVCEFEAVMVQCGNRRRVWAPVLEQLPCQRCGTQFQSHFGPRQNRALV